MYARISRLEKLLENKGVSLTPRSVFGSNGEGHLRISYATSMEDILEGVKRLEECLQSILQSRIVTIINKEERDNQKD